MRTRLQMTATEARVGRDRKITNLDDLAAFLGAAGSAQPALQAALRTRYDGGLCVRAAVLPREETWELRFFRLPGGWSVEGESVSPIESATVSGNRIPRYVRLAIPIDPRGLVPYSLAPRRTDLPKIARGTWRGVARVPWGLPRVALRVDVPVHGIVISLPAGPAPPIPVMFPIRTADLVARIRALVEARRASARAHIMEHNERRRHASAAQNAAPARRR